MTEIKEIPEKEFEEYGQGIDSTEQDELDAEEMMQYDDLPMPDQGLGGIYSLFGKVIDQENVVRLANLDRQELGTLTFTVRGCLLVAKQAYTFGHPIFAKYFADQAGIVLDTSLSKEGYLISTFVTSKRYATSTKDPSDSLPPIEPKKKKSNWKMFSK